MPEGTGLSCIRAHPSFGYPSFGHPRRLGGTPQDHPIKLLGAIPRTRLLLTWRSSCYLTRLMRMMRNAASSTSTIATMNTTT